MPPTSENPDGLRDLSLTLIGLLLGSGVSGTTIAIAEKQPKIWFIVAIFVVASLVIFLINVWSDYKRRTRSIDDLSGNYISVLSTAGNILSARIGTLDLHPEKIGRLRKEILGILIDDLREQSSTLLATQKNLKSLQIFDQGIQKITERWESYKDRWEDEENVAAAK